MIFYILISIVFTFSFITKKNTKTNDALIDLGRHLFFDQKLSANLSKSCSTCHDPKFAFTDGYKKSIGNYDSRTVTNAGTNSVTYISPISEDDNCSANYVFLLTDGDPLDDANVVDNVKKATDVDCTGGNAVAKNWNCMKELATYNNGTSTKSGAPKKRLYTSTMILGPLGGTAETNMTSVAALGGGKFYKATDTGALAAAFTDVINEAMKASGTISAAGVAVNQLNRLNHLVLSPWLA